MFIMAPVLAYYNASLETWVKTDFSDFVTVGVLRLVAFFFKKDVTNGVQLYDPQQEAVSNYQEF